MADVDEISIRYFAQFQEIAGCQQEAITLDGPLPLDQLLERLRQKYPKIKEPLDHTAISVNLETVNPNDTTVKPGDEVALLPPFGGGQTSRKSRKGSTG